MPRPSGPIVSANAITLDRKAQRRKREPTSSDDIVTVQRAIGDLSSDHVKSLRLYVEMLAQRRPDEIVVLADVPIGRIGEKIIVSARRTSGTEQTLNFTITPKSSTNATFSRTPSHGRTQAITLAYSIAPTSAKAVQWSFEPDAPVDAAKDARARPSDARRRTAQAGALMEKAFDDARNRLLRQGLSTPAAAERLALTPEGVRKRASRKELFALKLGRDYRFPAWQFASRSPDGILAGLREILHVCVLDPLELAAWFERKTQALDDRTPIQALEEGDIADVVAAAEAAGVT